MTPKWDGSVGFIDTDLKGGAGTVCVVHRFNCGGSLNDSEGREGSG